MKNHSKETESVSKNAYCFTQEKRKKQRFFITIYAAESGMGDYYEIACSRLVFL